MNCFKLSIQNIIIQIIIIKALAEKRTEFHTFKLKDERR
jgi:hypothetical protein